MIYNGSLKSGTETTLKLEGYLFCPQENPSLISWVKSYRKIPVGFYKTETLHLDFLNVSTGTCKL